MSDVESSLIDLDALAPKPAKIKFGGKTIEVQPPKVRHVLRLGFLGQKMQDLADLTDEQADQLIADLENEIKQVIPELAEASFNASQLMELLTLVVSMGMPDQAETLKAKGITVDSQKKAPLE
jgi:hypothetical protein